jgi:hypothetical protein
MAKSPREIAVEMTEHILTPDVKRAYLTRISQVVVARSWFWQRPSLCAAFEDEKMLKACTLALMLSMRHVLQAAIEAGKQPSDDLTALCGSRSIPPRRCG